MDGTSPVPVRAAFVAAGVAVAAVTVTSATHLFQAASAKQSPQAICLAAPMLTAAGFVVPLCHA